MDVNSFPVGERWFAGKGRRIVAVAISERIEISGGELAFADVEYERGGGERYLLLDRLDWSALLRTLADGPVAGALGRLELRGSPPLDGLEGQRTPATDQTNTLVALADRLLVKAYRRLEPGPHPEIELLTRLRGRGAPVPAALGSIHHVADDGSVTALALLEEFVPGAEDGWEAPIERVASHLRGEGPAPIEEFGEAGRTAARLHDALADEGRGRFGPADAAAVRDSATANLRRAADAEPELVCSRELLSRLEGLRRLEGTSKQHTHGDLHYAQFLRAPGRPPVVIDFEGDPTRPLAERVSVDSPLRDLACLIRSIDHIGSAASRRVGIEPDSWIADARAAALTAYGPVDHVLLHALELAEEVRELVYAQTTLPEWLYAPRHGLRRLLGEKPA